MHVVGNRAEERGLALTGRGLFDATRLASSPPDIWRDICRSNADAVGDALDDFIAELQALRSGLDTGRRSIASSTRPVSAGASGPAARRSAAGVAPRHRVRRSRGASSMRPSPRSAFPRTPRTGSAGAGEHPLPWRRRSYPPRGARRHSRSCAPRPAGRVLRSAHRSRHGYRHADHARPSRPQPAAEPYPVSDRPGRPLRRHQDRPSGRPRGDRRLSLPSRASPPLPSATDTREADDTGLLYVIASPALSEVRAYRLDGGRLRSVELRTTVSRGIGRPGS